MHGSNMKKTLAERFAEKVCITARCHEWTGHLMPNGYGQFHANGKTAYAHRIAWELKNGPIKIGTYVLHKCDNRKCVNPEHLFLGSFADNMADMVAKRRQAHGTRNGKAKLTEVDVVDIKSGSLSQRLAAAKFGVSQATISMIRNGHTWKFVR